MLYPSMKTEAIHFLALPKIGLGTGRLGYTHIDTTDFFLFTILPTERSVELI